MDSQASWIYLSRYHQSPHDIFCTGYSLPIWYKYRHADMVPFGYHDYTSDTQCSIFSDSVRVDITTTFDKVISLSKIDFARNKFLI